MSTRAQIHVIDKTDDNKNTVILWRQTDATPENMEKIFREAATRILRRSKFDSHNYVNANEMASFICGSEMGLVWPIATKDIHNDISYVYFFKFVGEVNVEDPRWEWAVEVYETNDKFNKSQNILDMSHIHTWTICQQGQTPDLKMEIK